MQHDLPFDPTYGYTLETLLTIGSPDGPEDFDAFWQQTYREARAVAPEPVMRQIDSPRRSVDVYEVEFTGLGGFRVGGWVTIPSDGQFTRGVVVGHGYGGRKAPHTDMPGPPAAHLFVCGRGFHRSARPDLPTTAAWHVIHGIERRETYLHRFCVADFWSAVSALIELFPQVGDAVDYFGASFGGGIGAMSLPWEPRFRRAFLGVPSFGHHPIRLGLPCVGSGEAVRTYHKHHPDVTQVLAYFDAATASRYTRIPVLVAAALFDPAVPPPGQFAVYNALRGQKKLFIHEAAHFSREGEQEENARRRQQLDAWFGLA